jgi:protein-tyrosine-phosphatase
MSLREHIRSLKAAKVRTIEIARKLEIDVSTVYYHTNDKTRRRQIDRLLKLKRDNKLRAVAYKGGHCQKCGYNRCLDALTFHHRDPNAKEIRIGGQAHSWERLQAELDKTVLLCCLCHTELHAGLWSQDELNTLGLTHIPNGMNTGRLILPPSKRRARQ